MEIDLNKKYYVIATGGSIGDSKRGHRYLANGISGMVYATFDSKEEAQDAAAKYRKQLSAGEKSYYKMGYRVVNGNIKHIRNAKVEENKMNKLQETKLKKIIKEEYQKILNEDLDLDMVMVGFNSIAVNGLSGRIYIYDKAGKDRLCTFSTSELELLLKISKRKNVDGV